jgi:short-subunit dehydrogenase
MRLDGKVVVITGGSMGIGEAIAKVFVLADASVAICSRDLARAEAARIRIGHTERTLAIALDVTSGTQIDSAVKAVMEKYGRIDVWVNNAGLGMYDSIELLDVRSARKLFDTNYFGALECMQAVIPVMRRQHGGTIVNISSIAGHIGAPYSGAYCATKHALNAISNAARVELKGSGVHILTVCPGMIATEFSANVLRGRDPRRIGGNAKIGITADEVAAATLDAYMKGKREIFVPAKDKAAVWLYRWMPEVVEKKIVAMLKPVAQ